MEQDFREWDDDISSKKESRENEKVTIKTLLAAKSEYNSNKNQCVICKADNAYEISAGFSNNYCGVSHFLCLKHALKFKLKEIQKNFGVGEAIIAQKAFAEKLCHLYIRSAKDDNEAETILSYMIAHIAELTQAKKHVNFFDNDIKRIQELKSIALNAKELFDSIAYDVFANKNYRQSSRRFTPVLLAGPPGLGKTFSTELVAKRLKIDHAKIQVSTMATGADFGGLSVRWKTPGLGALAKSLMAFKAHTGVIVLDEIDKFTSSREHGSVFDSLLHLLEEDTCNSLTNELLEMPMNTNDILWIATANDLSKIPEPILSRFKIINIKKLTRSQSEKITNAIYQQACDKWLGEGYSCNALSKKIHELTANLSIRDIKLTINEAVNRAAFLNQGSKVIDITMSDFIDDNKVEQVFESMNKLNCSLH